MQQKWTPFGQASMNNSNAFQKNEESSANAENKQAFSTRPNTRSSKKQFQNSNHGSNDETFDMPAFKFSSVKFQSVDKENQSGKTRTKKIQFGCQVLSQTVANPVAQQHAASDANTQFGNIRHQMEGNFRQQMEGNSSSQFGNEFFKFGQADNQFGQANQYGNFEHKIVQNSKKVQKHVKQPNKIEFTNDYQPTSFPLVFDNNNRPINVTSRNQQTSSKVYSNSKLSPEDHHISSENFGHLFQGSNQFGETKKEENMFQNSFSSSSQIHAQNSAFQSHHAENSNFEFTNPFLESSLNFGPKPLPHELWAKELQNQLGLQPHECQTDSNSNEVFGMASFQNQRDRQNDGQTPEVSKLIKQLRF